jgi:hypothetical protein
MAEHMRPINRFMRTIPPTTALNRKYSVEAMNRGSGLGQSLIIRIIKESVEK